MRYRKYERRYIYMYVLKYVCKVTHITRIWINGWRTIKSLVHKIRLHGRRGKGTAESFSREKLRHAPQKKGG